MDTVEPYIDRRHGSYEAMIRNRSMGYRVSSRLVISDDSCVDYLPPLHANCRSAVDAREETQC